MTGLDQILTTVGLGLQIPGAYLLGVEAVKLKNVEKLRDRWESVRLRPWRRAQSLLLRFVLRGLRRNPAFILPGRLTVSGLDPSDHRVVEVRRLERLWLMNAEMRWEEVETRSLGRWAITPYEVVEKVPPRQLIQFHPLFEFMSPRQVARYFRVVPTDEEWRELDLDARLEASERAGKAMVRIARRRIAVKSLIFPLIATIAVLLLAAVSVMTLALWFAYLVFLDLPVKILKSIEAHTETGGVGIVGIVLLTCGFTLQVIGVWV